MTTPALKAAASTTDVEALDDAVSRGAAAREDDGTAEFGRTTAMVRSETRMATAGRFLTGRRPQPV